MQNNTDSVYTALKLPSHCRLMYTYCNWIIDLAMVKKLCAAKEANKVWRLLGRKAIILPTIELIRQFISRPFWKIEGRGT